MKVNINADLGESFGPWPMGDDPALLDIVATANVACGMHAGDPEVMRRTLLLAKEKGVSVGAHPGFDDLRGFGRRQIRMPAREIEALVAYQIGALMGLAAMTGMPVTHVKAHGALNNMASVDDGYARAIVAGVRGVDPTLIHLVMPNTALDRATRDAGLPLAREAFVDRAYEPDGTLTPRSEPGAMIHDPDEAAARALRLVREGVMTTRDGREIRLEAESLCVHGDEPGAVETARRTRALFEAEGVTIATLPEMLA